MELDSDSTDDYDEQMQDLKQLSAALENETPTVDTNSIKSGSESMLSPNANQEQLYWIERALSLNSMLDEKYKRLEIILSLRLRECRKKLAENAKDVSQITKRNEPFHYYSCGKPYFKDKNNVAAPDNEDTILMRKFEMYDFSDVHSASGWTVRDKSLLVNTLHKMSQVLRKEELNSKIAKLRRENGSKKEINKLKKELGKVKKKSLAELALPIDQDYDWDNVANVLNNRHSPSEYQALWKLYLHPSINKSSWSRKEHQKLQEIAIKHDQQNWDAIAKELNTGRTAYQCFVYFRANITKEFTGRKWSKEEVEYLKRLVDYYREDNYIPWGKVASAMENRTKKQVYSKYLRVVEQRKGRFLAEEDSVILNCVESFGLDFRKIAKYLPGRSALQIRTRYNLLSKMRLSTTWSIEEDKKLLQIMANQDSSANFSTATKHFPGKDRIIIRTRYNTLQRWMTRNPNKDISFAPRRGARQLLHGEPSNDLNKSLENLKNRMENEVIKTMKFNKKNKHSSETDIEEAIMQFLYKETLQKEEEEKKLQQKTAQQIVKCEGINNKNTEGKLNTTNLKKLLIFINAKLNKNICLKSGFFKTYSELAKSNDEHSQLEVKSYSRKHSVTKIQIGYKPDIWGENPLEKGQQEKYTLPPNLATITGCRVLMDHISKNFTIPSGKINISLMARRNEELKKCLATLKVRFAELFLWPILLSNASPNRAEKKLPEGVACYPLNMHLQPARNVKAGPSKESEPVNYSVETDSDSQEDITAISDFSSTDEDDL